jgi:signal transduction histidine kinase
VASAILILVAFGLGWLLFRALTRPLIELAGTAGKIAAGELDVSFGPHPRHDEIGQLADSLERMTAALRTQAAHLRESAKRTVAGQDAERHRLARDLHDGAQQRLVTLSLILRMARTRLGSSPAPELEGTLREAAHELAHAQSELRELARGIHPAILTDEGLGPALESLADRSLVPATITAAPNDRLPAPVEATAYFIVSEALTNVAKYAHASLVTISASEINGSLLVEVTDDGVGGADPTKGSGLCGLTDRATALGGWLRIESPRGQGTRIVAQVPCE